MSGGNGTSRPPNARVELDDDAVRYHARGDDQWPAEEIERMLAENHPPLEPNRLPPLVAAETVVPTIAKALCRHTTRAPGCACGDDPVVCFAMAIFGDMATAVARDLKRRGRLR
jgi:hypothetical protein